MVDKDGVIVIGHCRYDAAKVLGMKDVPCVCVDNLTEEEVKALRIVDNKSNESPWDMDLLVQELEDIDLSNFCFDFGICGEDEENPYNTKIEIPHYGMQGEKPDISELFDSNL